MTSALTRSRISILTAADILTPVPRNNIWWTKRATSKTWTTARTFISKVAVSMGQMEAAQTKSRRGRMIRACSSMMLQKAWPRRAQWLVMRRTLPANWQTRCNRRVRLQFPTNYLGTRWAREKGIRHLFKRWIHWWTTAYSIISISLKNSMKAPDR